MMIVFILVVFMLSEEDHIYYDEAINVWRKNR